MTGGVLTGRPGAVVPDGGAVAAHYGDPLREQRTLAERAGLVDRSDRDVLAIPGADRLTWLHDLTTQHLSALTDGTGTEALVLSPHGHVEHHLVLADVDGTTWADLEPGTGAGLQTFLDRMRFLLRVEPALVSDRWALLTVAGPESPGVLAAAGLPAPGGAWQVTGADGGWVRRMPGLEGGLPEFDLLVARDRAVRVADALLDAGAAPAGLDAYEALRVAARRPRFGLDTDHRTIPNELSWLRTAVHLDKGCYRGQETVARVHNLGRPPRRRVLLHLDGLAEELPAPGVPVHSGAREVGRVGTVVRHHELGVVALALVKQSVAVDAALAVGGAAAAIDPDDAAGALDDTRAAARGRVRAVRSATIPR